MSLAVYMLLALKVQLIRCQDWTWVGGDKIADMLSTDSYPGGRSGSSIWSSNTSVWMFGGNGFSDLGSGKSHLLNDVWSFDTDSKVFKLENPGTWTSVSDPVLYSTSFPAGRQHAAMCGDLGRLVIFGGVGDGNVALGDLWEYDVNSKKWQELKLSNDSSQVPAARGHSSVWCSKSDMYIFGGINDNKTLFADTWKLNLLTLTWTKLHEKSIDSMSSPAGRNGAAAWTSGDILYMFSGNTNSSFSYTSRMTADLKSDLWSFYPNNNTWHFIAGIGVNSMNNDLSSRCLSNFPKGRLGAAAWTDSNGNLWLFGGSTITKRPFSLYHSILLSDMWMFDLAYHFWTLTDGSDSEENAGKYGEFKAASRSNLPGARTEMVAWKGGDNLVFIFGGLGHGESHFGGYLNDLWIVDISIIISREYLIAPVVFLSFFGVALALLVTALIIALCSRRRQRKQGSRLELKLSPEYCKLDTDEW